MTDHKKLRIIFMGTPDFAVGPLDALHGGGHEIAAVYTQPPRPRGRGQKIQNSPVHQYALDHGLRVRTPADFKEQQDVADFQALQADVAVVAAYGMLLPQVILDAPKHGCLNIHPSLLPRWRGTSPVQFALWNGDKRTGVSVMRLVRRMDAGPLIAVREIDIPPRATYESLSAQLWALGAEMIVEAADRLALNGVLEARPQAEEGLTYTKMLKKEDGLVDWAQSAEAIDRQVRALNPWPGVRAAYEGKIIKILETSLPLPLAAGSDTGVILGRDGYVACGDGTMLQLVKIQPEGAKSMDFAAAMNGGYVKVGGRFS